MAVVLKNGILGLVEGVRTYLEAHDRSDVEVLLGWKERPKQGNGNRLVFQPSDPSGKGGKMLPSRGGPGPRDLKEGDKVVARVRALADHEVLFTCFVWGKGSTEAEHIANTWDLYQWAIRAIHATGFADLSLSGDINWTHPTVEKHFGKELSFTFTFRIPILDVPQEIVYPEPALETTPKHDE